MAQPMMHKEITAYVCLGLLAAFVASAGLAAVTVTDGALSYPAAAAAAAGAFQALRRTTGRLVGAIVDTP